MCHGSLPSGRYWRRRAHSKFAPLHGPPRSIPATRRRRKVQRACQCGNLRFARSGTRDARADAGFRAWVSHGSAGGLTQVSRIRSVAFRARGCRGAAPGTEDCRFRPESGREVPANPVRRLRDGRPHATGVAREPRLRSTSPRSLGFRCGPTGRLCVPQPSQCHAGAWHGWCSQRRQVHGSARTPRTSTRTTLIDSEAATRTTMDRC
jgi:hypothetical protein